jgi:glycosyltransferase involved in cell wall biosynthesis
MRQPERYLVLSLAPYRYATRARKAADVLALTAPTLFVSLSAAGRTGRRDRPGRFRAGSVSVIQVPIRGLASGVRRTDQMRNLLLAYLPAFLRLFLSTLRSPAQTVLVTNPALLLLGLIHKMVFRSSLVLDIPERPGLVASGGSLAAHVSRIEPFMLRHASKFVSQVMVVVPPDVATLHSFGFEKVALVRNSPMEKWRAPYREPIPRTGRNFRCVLIGSIFENRGFEAIIDAFALLVNRDAEVELHIVGPVRDSYKETLLNRIAGNQLDRSIYWHPAIESEEVSSAYMDADLGLVLYEAADPGNDGLSNKILECVSSGRPVLASDLPENRRFVSENRVGWLSGMSSADLAVSITEIMGSDDLAELSARCRALGDSQLTWEKEFSKALRLPFVSE